MKKQELRIGNFVSHEGAIKKIASIEVFDLCFLYYAGYNACVDIPDIQPIPLNDEWCKKLGLDVYEANIENEYIMINRLINPVRYYYQNTELKTVHQLQNLYFALTGNELKIK
jgi:hypothetical protein